MHEIVLAAFGNADGPLETAYFSWSMRKVNLPDEVQPGLLITIWETTARKAVELALSEKSERYKALFDSIDQGFCIIEIIFDSSGERAVDYRFLEVNPAFEAQSGMHDVVGRRMLEFVPSIEKHWLNNYGHVALTGEPMRFADEYKTLHRWFDVYAYTPEVCAPIFPLHRSGKVHPSADGWRGVTKR